MDEMLPRLATFALIPLTVTIAVSALTLARLGYYYSCSTFVCYRCRQTFNIDDTLTGLESHAHLCASSAAATPSSVTATQRQAACHDAQQNLTFCLPKTSPEVPSCQPAHLLAGNNRSYDDTPGGNVDTNASREYIGMPTVNDSTNMSQILRHHPDFERLKDEHVRLSTFFDWPERVASIVNPHELARAGMFYTGQTDRVQCVYCRGYLRNWVQGDVPADEHRRLFPKCPFIRQQNDDHITAAATSSPSRSGHRQLNTAASALSSDKSSCRLQQSFQVCLITCAMR